MADWYKKRQHISHQLDVQVPNQMSNNEFEVYAAVLDLGENGTRGLINVTKEAKGNIGDAAQADMAQASAIEGVVDNERANAAEREVQSGP